MSSEAIGGLPLTALKCSPLQATGICLWTVNGFRAARRAVRSFHLVGEVPPRGLRHRDEAARPGRANCLHWWALPVPSVRLGAQGSRWQRRTWRRHRAVSDKDGPHNRGSGTDFVAGRPLLAAHVPEDETGEARAASGRIDRREKGGPPAGEPVVRGATGELAVPETLWHPDLL